MRSFRTHYDYLDTGYSPDKGEDFAGVESLTDPSFYESFEDLVARILAGDRVPSREPVWDKSDVDAALWERGVDISDFPPPSDEDIKAGTARAEDETADEAERKADPSQNPAKEPEKAPAEKTI